MLKRNGLWLGCMVVALTCGLGHAMAAKKPAEPVTPLSEAGERHLARYTAALQDLQAQITKALPTLDEQQKAAFLKAHLNQFNANVAAAKALAATTNKSPEKKEQLAAALKAAQEVQARAKAEAAPQLAKALADLDKALSSESLDAKLVKAAVIASATPRGLAVFAQQGSEHEVLIDRLLANDKLMRDMLIAGGARENQYGPAMQIYTAIAKASPRASQGMFQRLALATSLEHAVPIEQENAQTDTNAAKFIDPVKRYQHYEKAYLDGELDPAFKDFNAWEYRMVINCDAPDEILAWGRQMLRTFRPDQVYKSDYGWRYSESVRSEVTYGSQHVKDDLPSQNMYQNIPLNGGVCGRRAFYGRFILRSFGIPTWGVTQHAHAALSHWTPSGWVINLGAGWQWSWWDHEKVKRSGTNFVLETQAREQAVAYMKVLRAQWISAALSEPFFSDRMNMAGGFWSALAHHQTVAIVAGGPSKELGPLGQELGEVDESKAEQKAEKVQSSEADRKILIGADGRITIPAAASSKPTASKGHITFMKSFPDGQQVHFRAGRDPIEYTVDVPKAGKYQLSAKVATLQDDQTMMLTVNDEKTSVSMPVPYTVGLWKQTTPLEVTLAKGRNVIRFVRPDKSRGVSIKEFTLLPMR